MKTHRFLRALLQLVGIPTALLIGGCGGGNGNVSSDSLHAVVTFQQTSAAAAAECARTLATSPRLLVSVTEPATPDSTLPPSIAVCAMQGKLLQPQGTVAAPATAGGVTLAYAMDAGPVFASTVSGTSGPPTVAGQPTLRRYALLALLNAAPGQQAEFERFINTEHIPDVLRNPGFTSAQRYRLLYPLTAGVSIYPATSGVVVPATMILYEFESYDVNASVAEVVRRLVSGVTRSSPAMGQGGHVYFVAPVAN